MSDQERLDQFAANYIAACERFGQQRKPHRLQCDVSRGVSAIYVHTTCGYCGVTWVVGCAIIAGVLRTSHFSTSSCHQSQIELLIGAGLAPRRDTYVQINKG